MDIAKLRGRLEGFAEALKDSDKTLLQARLKAMVSVYPFNEYEYMLMFLMDRKIIGFQDYETLRRGYVSSNKYLDLYGLAPRIFGEIWGHQHIMDLDKRFTRPDRRADSRYSGEYDLRIDGIRVEVKAARAINTKKRGDLVSKALPFGSAEPFWMNFQQIKPDACDAFVFIGVFVDEIVYWVMSKEEVRTNKYISHQHRGGIEYQVGITGRNIKDFDIYRTKATELAESVCRKGKELNGHPGKS